MHNFVVTTRLECVPKTGTTFMIDGTVPGWEPKKGDYHFDHHRHGGAAIQIDEIDLSNIKLGDNLNFVTTQVDADAIAAAAYILTKGQELQPDAIQKLRAIAYDCDHLLVPPELSEYADFAAKAVAALKEVSNRLVKEFGFPIDRKQWSIEQKEFHAGMAFADGTWWLRQSMRGRKKWPGESGEADAYWERCQQQKEVLKKKERVWGYRGCTLIDFTGLDLGYIDPRVPLWIVSDGELPEHPITLTQRERVINGKFEGYSYTLGSIPLHPKLEGLDYTQGVFQALTKAESECDLQSEGWGGRKTVGGSGWNTCSNLSPEKIINIVLEVLGT